MPDECKNEQASCNSYVFPSSRTLFQKLVIVSVTETLAYGKNEELGAVFIPGAAFPKSQVEFIICTFLFLFSSLSVIFYTGELEHRKLRNHNHKSC